MWLLLVPIFLFIFWKRDEIAAYMIEKGYKNNVAFDLEVLGIGPGFVMAKDAAEHFNMMKVAAFRDGIELQVNSAFRTYEKQQELYNAYQSQSGNLAAMPGYSNHQSGISVDIDVDSSFKSKTYLWLKVNAGRFGYVNDGASFKQPEPWHWTYKGVSYDSSLAVS